MAMLLPVLGGVISGVVGLVGAMASAQATIAAGQAQRMQAEHEAKQLEIRAQEQRASAQREAEEAKLQGRLAQSKVQTAAAAGGFMPTSTDILDLSGDVAQRTGYQAGMYRYRGHEQAVGTVGQAAANRWSGVVAENEARQRASATIIGGIGGMFNALGSIPWGSTGSAGSAQPSYYYGGATRYA